MTGKQLREELLKESPNCQFIDGEDDSLIGRYLDPTGDMHPLYSWSEMVRSYELRQNVDEETALVAADKARHKAMAELTGPGHPLIVDLRRFQRHCFGDDLLAAHDNLMICIKSKWFDKLSFSGKRQVANVKTVLERVIYTDCDQPISVFRP